MLKRKLRASDGPQTLENVRWPQNMLKRKLRAPDGPQTLKNVSSNRSWPPLLVIGPSQGPPIAFRALLKAPPKPSRSSPGALC